MSKGLPNDKTVSRPSRLSSGPRGCAYCRSTHSKRPAQEITGWQGYCNQPPSDSKRTDWLARYADRNIGLLTGSNIGSGEVLAAIDIDQNEFVAVTATILGSGGVSKIGRKGRTDFMRCAKELRSTKINDCDKAGVIDVLIGGKMTVVPPSIHPDTGTPYRWVGTSLLEADLASLPVLDERKLALLKYVVRSTHARTLVRGNQLTMRDSRWPGP